MLDETPMVPADPSPVLGKLIARKITAKGALCGAEISLECLAAQENASGIDLNLQVGESTARLTFEPAALQQLLLATGYDTTWAMWPIKLRALVLSHLVQPFLGELSEKLGVPLSVRPEFQGGARSGTEVLGLQVTSDISRGQSTMLHVSATEDLWTQVDALFEQSGSSDDFEQADDAMRLVSIRSKPHAMSLVEFRSLLDGDVILTDAGESLDQVVNVSIDGSLPIGASRSDEGAFFLEEAPDLQAAPRRMSSALLGADEVLIEFELDRRSISQNLFEEMCETQELPGSETASDWVTIFANGARFGTGTRVEIGDQTGVRLKSIG